HPQMLLGSGRPAKPAVVRNVDEQIRTIRREVADFAGIDGFVADENAKRVAVLQFSNGVCRRALVETADLFGNAPHHLRNQRKRFVLAERNEMNLVVHEKPLSVRIEKQRTVVRNIGPRLVRISSKCGTPFDGARNKRSVKLLCERRREFGELSVLE